MPVIETLRRVRQSLKYIVNIMAADDLVMQEASASAATLWA